MNEFQFDFYDKHIVNVTYDTESDTYGEDADGGRFIVCTTYKDFDFKVYEISSGKDKDVTYEVSLDKDMYDEIESMVVRGILDHMEDS